MRAGQITIKERERIARLLHWIGEDPQGGGLFATEDCLGPATQWADLYFLGSHNGKDVIFNTTLETLKEAYRDAVISRVAENLAALMTAAEQESVSNELESVGSLNERFASLGGLTICEWEEGQGRVIADSGSVVVYEEATIDTGYQPGIGLHACIDAPYISGEAATCFILSFLAGECRPYRKPRPHTFSYEDLGSLSGSATALIR